MDGNMLALSTSWQSGESATADQMLEALTGTGIKGVELSYRVSEDLYQQLKRPLRDSGLKVVSIHNYFPMPACRLGLLVLCIREWMKKRKRKSQ